MTAPVTPKAPQQNRTRDAAGIPAGASPDTGRKGRILTPEPPGAAAGTAPPDAAPSPMAAGDVERPDAPAAPLTAAPMALGRALCFMLAATVIGLAQGLQQGFVSTSLPQIAGDLGITTTNAAWLLVAYMVPRAALPVLLIKIRTQYGLRRFAEIGVAVYALVALASLWAQDFRSAMVLQTLAGAAAAPLSTLAFLYMLEPLSPPAKMVLGLPLAMVVLMTGPSLARVIGPELIETQGLAGLHLAGLGLALLSVMLVLILPLQSAPRQRVIRRTDFLSFGLIGAGFGGLIAAFVMGPILNWGDAPWIGAALAGAVLALALAVAVELNRAEPLLDIRWLASPAMLHLTGTLLVVRLILSEQSAGAPRMFQVLGVGPEQMTGLFAVICLAGLSGGLACIAWMRPGRAPAFHLAALVLIALGAWLDSGAGLQTRPEQMILSQGLIGFAAMLFLPPAMMEGLIQALSKGPNYILSFVIVFISTQSLGGVLGSGLFTTFTTARQAAHLQDLAAQLPAADPVPAMALTARMAQLAPRLADPAAQRAQAVTELGGQLARQAWVAAYADAYALTGLAAAIAAGLLILHRLRDRLAASALIGARP